MNTTTLIKLSPMLLMIAFLAYAGYSIHSSAADPDGGPSALAKEVDSVVQELRAVGNAIATVPVGPLRDPFQVAAKPAAAEVETEDDAPLESAGDPLAEIVKKLRLDATFVQGRDQIAIIDGRIYTKGQHLVGSGQSAGTASELFLVGVLPSKAVLHANGRNFVLSYSDQLTSPLDKGKPGAAESARDGMAEIDPGGQLAMFQKLFNSPLGALGKSMIGNGEKRGGRPRAGARSNRGRSGQ
jgi:hypothetical protein